MKEYFIFDREDKETHEFDKVSEVEEFIADVIKSNMAEEGIMEGDFNLDIVYGERVPFEIKVKIAVSGE